MRASRRSGRTQGAQAIDRRRVGQSGEEWIRPTRRSGECRPVGRLPKGWQSAADDAELLHAGLQRGALETQDLRGAALAADPPRRLLEDVDDVAALDVFETARLGRPRDGGAGRRGEIRRLETPPGGEDHRPLDYVLQFAHVAGPGVGGETVEHL